MSTENTNTENEVRKEVKSLEDVLNGYLEDEFGTALNRFEELVRNMDLLKQAESNFSNKFKQVNDLLLFIRDNYMNIRRCAVNNIFDDSKIGSLEDCPFFKAFLTFAKISNSPTTVDGYNKFLRKLSFDRIFERIDRNQWIMNLKDLDRVVINEQFGTVKMKRYFLFHILDLMFGAMNYLLLTYSWKDDKDKVNTECWFMTIYGHFNHMIYYNTEVSLKVQGTDLLRASNSVGMRKFIKTIYPNLFVIMVDKNIAKDLNLLKDMVKIENNRWFNVIIGDEIVIVENDPNIQYIENTKDGTKKLITNEDNITITKEPKVPESIREPNKEKKSTKVTITDPEIDEVNIH